ncbi:MAG TPA: hypothetical protein VGC21_01085 [Telluria sp.]|jgi:hypothetical protein
MLRSSTLCKLLSILLLAHAGGALAQQKPSEAPPKLEVIEEGSDTPIVVTPPKTGGAKITEKKEGGRTTEAKVKTGKSTYTMKGASPAAVNERGDRALGNGLGTPQWQVMEFDLGRKKKTDKEDVPAADAPPPPPPAK